MSADFRQLANKGQSGRPDRLFRAAISAYCALVRPGRRDAAQLDDLTLPLFDAVSPNARRFAAAALSECERAPSCLVRQLLDEPVEISAPLLIRSRAIGDIDLVRAIGRHGLPHARAIARRPNLHPAIAQLLDAFRDPEIERLRKAKRSATLHSLKPASMAETVKPAQDGAAAENARRRLRSMMLPASEATSRELAGRGELTFRKLRDTALSGHPALFETALADALGTELSEARRLTRQGRYRDLITALAKLGLTEEKAYLIVSALFPAEAGRAEAIKLFLYRYRLAAEELDSAVPPVAGDLIRKAS